MSSIEIISWQTLDALKNAATKIIDIVGDIETGEHMSIFCCIEEDFLELYYSELDSSMIRHFSDEDEMEEFITKRKNEFGEEEYDSMGYYSDEEEEGEDYDGFKIAEGEDEEDF